MRHNNVLGYHIEITTANADKLKTTEAGRAFIHRQTTAQAQRHTNAALSDLASRIADAAGEALAIEISVFDQLVGEVMAASARDRRRGRRRGALGCRGGAWRSLAVEANYVRPVVNAGAGVRDFARAASGGRSGAQGATHEGFVANDCDLSGNGQRAAVARHRAEHGRQVDVSAPERADRDFGAGRVVRAGGVGRDRHRRPVVQPRGRGRRSGARALDVHGRDGGDGRHSQSGDGAVAGHPRRDRARHGDVRRPVDRVGDGRAAQRRQSFARVVRDALPRTDRAWRRGWTASRT